MRAARLALGGGRQFFQEADAFARFVRFLDPFVGDQALEGRPVFPGDPIERVLGHLGVVRQAQRGHKQQIGVEPIEQFSRDGGADGLRVRVGGRLCRPHAAAKRQPRRAFLVFSVLVQAGPKALERGRAENEDPLLKRGLQALQGRPGLRVSEGPFVGFRGDFAVEELEDFGGCGSHVMVFLQPFGKEFFELVEVQEDLPVPDEFGVEQGEAGFLRAVLDGPAAGGDFVIVVAEGARQGPGQGGLPVPLAAISRGL